MKKSLVNRIIAALMAAAMLLLFGCGKKQKFLM